MEAAQTDMLVAYLLPHDSERPGNEELHSQPSTAKSYRGVGTALGSGLVGTR